MKKGPCWAIGLIVTALTAGLYWIYPPTLHRLELLYQNVHFQFRGPVQPGPEVAIIAIDEKSVDEQGRWPWSRKTMSRLVEKLVERQVRVIGFDVVFSSPEENPFKDELENLRVGLESTEHAEIKDSLDRFLRDSDHDAQFASALRKSGRAVMGYFFHLGPEGLEHLSAEDKARFFKSVKRSQFSGFIKSSEKIDLSAIEFQEAYAAEGSIPVISEQVRLAGFINFFPEPDGTIRKLPLIVRYRSQPDGENYYFPPLSIRVLEKFLEGSFLFRVGEAGAEKVLIDSGDPVVIPTNEKGELHINFLGKAGSFPYYSATDILHDRSDLVPENSLRDKIVLIGATAPALEDLNATPFDPVFPGVEFHATVIDNVLRNSALRQPFWLPLAGLAYLLALGILLTFLYSRIKPVYGIFAWAAVAFLSFSVSHWFFIYQGFWLTDIFPVLENTLIIAGLMTYRYRTEEKQKQYIQSIFGQYLSTRVVDELLKNPAELKLGGEQKELTAFFTDLKGFTTLSEKLPPEELIRFLNDYLRIMTDILLKHEGTLDKYDGDAIKAFFGAPVYFADHARRACMVCVEMQEKLAQLRRQWAKEGKPELFMRIGINTGLMVVGNMGTKNRMSYGMNGDSVNLAARLEGANKAYDTFSMISESTYRQAKDFIEARELDSIRVVGKEQPVKVYELLGKTGSIDAGIKDILPLYQDGLMYYKKKSWDEAIGCFEKALARRTQDGPSSTMMNRCILLKENPPAKDWDGIFSLESK